MSEDFFPFIRLHLHKMEILRPLLEKRKQRNPSPSFMKINTTILLWNENYTSILKYFKHYNMYLMRDTYSEDTCVYIWNPVEAVNGDLSDETWVVWLYKRMDHGTEINISGPDISVVSEQVIEVFRSCGLIPWSEGHLVNAVGRPITKMLVDLSLQNGNSIILHPCYQYSSSPEDTAKINTTFGEEVSVGGMDVESGSKFIVATWKYAVEGSLDYVKKCIKRGVSCGVYLKDKGEFVSGILLMSNGMMGSLYTDESFRKKGYGRLSMGSLMKELTQTGFVPCSTVEMRNEASCNFHEKLGLKIIGEMAVLKYMPSVFDKKPTEAV